MAVKGKDSMGSTACLEVWVGAAEPVAQLALEQTALPLVPCSLPPYPSY